MPFARDFGFHEYNGGGSGGAASIISLNRMIQLCMSKKSLQFTYNTYFGVFLEGSDVDCRNGKGADGIPEDTEYERFKRLAANGAFLSSTYSFVIRRTFIFNTFGAS